VSSAGATSNLAASFEPHRRRLLGLAYRMLGSMADAEDAVQETYLRWHAADRDQVSDPRAFLMTTTTRICLDMLTSARARREEYVGPWLPEPVLDTAALAPDNRTELAEDLSIALLLTLERLSPLERAAFLAHGNRFLRSCCPSNLYPTFVAPIVAWLRCRSGEGPQSNALMAYVQQVRHATDHSVRIRAQPHITIEQMLCHIVGRIPDKWLRVNGELGLSLRPEDVARM